MTVDTSRIDVSRIMQDIRSEVRARQSDLELRLEQMREHILAHPGHDYLRQTTERINLLFGVYYAQVVDWINEQEPNYANMGRAIAELNRRVDDPNPTLSPRDRWWNPRYWGKRLLGRIRGILLRRQYETNAIMRDMLIYLVNHSAHLMHDRRRLELGVESVHAMHALLGPDGLLYYFLNEWPRLLPKPVLEHTVDHLDKFLHREGRNLETMTRSFLASQFESIRQQQDAFLTGGKETLERTDSSLGRIERLMGSLAPSKLGQIPGFDNLHLIDSDRGGEEEIRERQSRYVEFLRRAPGVVLDAGCGRGELLSILRESEIAAYGVEVDERLVEYCRNQELDVRHEDVVDHLRSLDDDSLGGLAAIQLIEHFDFPHLFQLLQLASRKIAPGGLIVLETVNPTCLTVFSGAFYADPTHRQPIHPHSAQQLLDMLGFTEIQFEYLSLVPESDRLKPLPVEAAGDPALREIIETLNLDIERINSVLYGYADYAVTGRRAGAV